jgi:hypothetical protein
LTTEATRTWGEGTVASPKYREAFDETHDDLRLSARYFTFDTDEGLVAGVTVDVTCSFDRPAAEVWTYFKDHTLWQDAYHHYYSSVIGDLDAGDTFALNTEPTNWPRHQYKMIRVIPEHVMIFDQPIPPDGSTGGVSPGVMVYMLSEYGGQTFMNVFMEHRFRTTELNEDEAIATFWSIPDALIKWRDVFIPALKMLVYDGEVPEDFKEHWRAEQAKVDHKYRAALKGEK